MIGLGGKCTNHEEMLEKDHENNALKYAKIAHRPRAGFRYLIKNVMNKQGQFIRKVIGTYSKLLLPWHSGGRCQTKSNDHQGAQTLNPD
jgi:hypothetical protein